MATPEPALSSGSWLSSAEWPARARRLGPLKYSDLGSRRLTPPAPEERGALASWVAASADQWWDAAGRPDPFTLVVVSGDDGQMARAVLDLGPRCAPALRYVLVDPDHAGRAGPPDGMARLVDLEEPAFLYPAAPSPVTPVSDADQESTDDELDAGERPAARGIGPLATFLTEVPSLGDGSGAIVAIGSLSRLPYDLYEKIGDAWCEVRVAASGDRLVEINVPGSEEGASPASLPTPLPMGVTRWRRLNGAVDWLRRQLPTAETGVLAVVDRWTDPGTAAPSDTESLDLHQLRTVREPLDPAPRPVEGARQSVVAWRLG